MKQALHKAFSLFGFTLLLGGAVFPARGEAATFPNRIGEKDFIADKAEMISPEDEAKIKKLCGEVLRKTAVPLIVVTITSLNDYKAADGDIARYAKELFNKWGIGRPEVTLKGSKEKLARNFGVLLLVSKNDRKARIELGADWGRTKDDACKKIMAEYIIPSFKRGDFSGGIRVGAEALAAIIMEKELPRVPRPWWHYLLIVVFIGLLIFTVVSLIRRGGSGWAWLFWAAVFGLLGWLLMTWLRSSAGRGGFSGGSFGGGFSGGGGATGSW